MSYRLPVPRTEPVAPPNTAYLVASGDLRPRANAAGWPTQEALEKALVAAFAELGWTVVRAHDYDPAKRHGFIDSQRRGLEVFATIPPDAPLVVAEAVWQYSHHVLAGLRSHRGPILTVANFDGTWPGLVGLLGLNAGLTKMGREYATIWSVDFTDRFFTDGLREWVRTGRITHDDAHVRPLPALPDVAGARAGLALAEQLLTEKAIIGVFDEGCMGMYNAIIDDELLNPLGIYKERLSQSALYAEMQRVPDAEADAVRAWLERAGMRFRIGTDEADRADRPAGARAAAGCTSPRCASPTTSGWTRWASSTSRASRTSPRRPTWPRGCSTTSSGPPVTSRDGARVLYDGAPLPHFNEADEGVAVDALVTNRVWTAMGLDPATTLHDVRWGEEFDGRFVWVYEISGSVPPSHLAGGYAGAQSWRQNPVYFPAGGGTIKGVSRPGEIVWSRLFIADGALHLDIGRASVVELPAAETERRWAATNPEWPIAHVVTHGVTRDQFMARHKANHVQIAYAPDAATADRALLAKAALFDRLGVTVHLCGDVDLQPGVIPARIRRARITTIRGRGP